MKSSRELRDLILGFNRDIETADPAALDLISDSDGTVLIGSASEEVYSGGPQIRALLTKQFEELGAADQVLRVGPRHPVGPEVALEG